MRICIFGAGAIGGSLAARFHKAGTTPALVVRGPHLAAIKAKGLTVRDADGSETRFAAEASDDPHDLGPQDLVVVTAKAPALPAIGRAIAPLLGPETAVLFVMNGIPWWYFQNHGGPHDDRRLPKLDPDDGLRRAIDPARILGGVIYCACTVESPGVVQVSSPVNRVILGEPNGQVTPRAQAVAKLLADGGMDTVATPKIRDAIWTKLVANFSSGTLSVATQSSMKAFYAEEACREATRRIVAEGKAVAAAMGCTVTTSAEELLARLAPSAHKPSILQDLELGRAMEVDGVYTVPLELARLAKVETPTLDLLITLLRLRAEAAGLYKP
ncbi:MAG TPA: 2-dehydropantoate 2-reductase [Alphaproteobacteria bacterium]|jgi:2-dehydropantoate 2-reductase